MEREGVVSSSKERSIRTKCTIPGNEKEKVGGVKEVWPLRWTIKPAAK